MAGRTGIGPDAVASEIPSSGECGGRGRCAGAGSVGARNTERPDSVPGRAVGVVEGRVYGVGGPKRLGPGVPRATMK